MSFSSIAARTLRTLLAAALIVIGSRARAQAQTTVVLKTPGMQVTDTMVQAGVFADTNFNAQDFLATRASTNPDYRRHALLKFDTQNTIPARAHIRSAVMTLTIKLANADPDRTIGVFPLTTSFVQQQATWNDSRTATAWVDAGGDFGPEVFRRIVPNTAGEKVSFDVTPLVQAVVRGAYSSRYTRLALADLGGSTANSYREYYSSKAGDALVRPVLTVVYGDGGTTETPAPPAESAPPAIPPITPPATPPACAPALDKASFAVGRGEANWHVNVTAAAGCAWHAASDSGWLVVLSTSPASATGSGYAKVRAIANASSPSKRVGHVAINSSVYTVTQGGCGSSCADAGEAPAPPIANPPPVDAPAGGPATQTTLRVLQYNTHHGGWGTDNLWKPNRIVDWVVQASPDLISMNEIEVGTGWSNGTSDVELFTSLIEQRTGRTWYAVFCEHDGRSVGNGNLILSAFPFVATASQLLPANRCAVDATIVVNGRNINFTSTHLDNVSAANRLQEVAGLLPFESSLADPRLVLGDMNAWPGATELKNIMNAGYIDTWPAAQTMGAAIGNGITHGSHRIDYIFQSTGGAAILNLKSVQIYSTADARGVMPSDHQPVLAVFEVK